MEMWSLVLCAQMALKWLWYDTPFSSFYKQGSKNILIWHRPHLHSAGVSWKRSSCNEILGVWTVIKNKMGSLLQWQIQLFLGPFWYFCSCITIFPNEQKPLLLWLNLFCFRHMAVMTCHEPNKSESQEKKPASGSVSCVSACFSTYPGFLASCVN